MVFDGARVHEQAQYDYGDDEAPPGIYFVTVHPGLVREGHKNRVGIYDEQGAGEGLFLDDVLEDDMPVDEPGADEAEPRRACMSIISSCVTRRPSGWARSRSRCAR